MKNTRSCTAILLAILLSLSSCAQTDEQRNYDGQQGRLAIYGDGGTYRLTDRDIQAFMDFAFGDNDHLVRLERDITYEIIGNNLHLFRPDFLNVLKVVEALTGVHLSPAPFGTVADYRVYFGRRFFYSHTTNEEKPSYAFHSHQCRMSMYINTNHEVEETRVSFKGTFFIHGSSMSLSSNKASVDNREDFLTCLESPFLRAFGALGSSPTSIPILTPVAMNQDSLAMNPDLSAFVLLAALYSPALKAGMKPADARAALEKTRQVQLPDMSEFELKYLRIWPYVPL